MVGELRHDFYTSGGPTVAVLTVIDGLLLCNLVLVSIKQRPQRVGNLGRDSLAAIGQLGQVVGLLYERVQGTNLERGDVE